MDEHEFVPFSYKIGDGIQISATDDSGRGKPFDCEIVEISERAAIAKSKVGFNYGLDFKTGKVTALDQWSRCVVCGKFICLCQKDRETKKETKEQEKIMKDLTPIPFADLEEYDNEQNIPMVEGTIKVVYEPKGDKYPNQNGFIKDDAGTEHRICFASESVFQDPDKVKGKRVRITSNFSKKSPTGVKMKVEGANGEYRKIWVTASAKLEFLGGDQSQSAGKSGSGAGAGGKVAVEGSQSSVKRRVFDYFRILSEVSRGYEAMKKDYNLPEFGPEDLRCVATGISMGFKGQYGVYADPLFPKGEDDSKRQSTDGNGEEGEAKLNGWRDFVHPSKDVTLGDVFDEDEDKLYEWITWAYSNDPKEESAKKLKVALMLAAAELKLPAKTVLEMRVITKLGALNKLHKDTLNDYSKEEYGLGWPELEDDDCEAILKNKNALKQIEAIDKKNKANETEEEEETELPE